MHRLANPQDETIRCFLDVASAVPTKPRLQSLAKQNSQKRFVVGASLEAAFGRRPGSCNSERIKFPEVSMHCKID